jgi:hypothetical protein
VLEKLGMHRATNAYFDLNSGAYYHLLREDHAPPDDISLAPPDE